uniref:Uncharacterized protein n=1 Tax=Anopheles atroparvus TaxID=41427 RepID=A0A182J3Q5_ANOAO
LKKIDSKMRKLEVILLALFHAALLAGAPVGEESGDLVRYENVQTENGYRFSYETKDGQMREEAGQTDTQSGVLRVSGWYGFRTPDGGTYRVDFVADENGYRTTEQPSVVIQVVPASVAGAGLSNAALLSLVG